MIPHHICGVLGNHSQITSPAVFGNHRSSLNATGNLRTFCHDWYQKTHHPHLHSIRSNHITPQSQCRSNGLHRVPDACDILIFRCFLFLLGLLFVFVFFGWEFGKWHSRQGPLSNDRLGDGAQGPHGRVLAKRKRVFFLY